MDNSKDREEIAKEIAKTSDLIRKKFCALKTEMEKDIALERHFKSIIDPLKQIIKNIVESSKDPIIIRLKHSFREKTRNHNLKENDRVLCMTILYRFSLL